MLAGTMWIQEKHLSLLFVIVGLRENQVSACETKQE